MTSVELIESLINKLNKDEYNELMSKIKVSESKSNAELRRQVAERIKNYNSKASGDKSSDNHIEETKQKIKEALEIAKKKKQIAEKLTKVKQKQQIAERIKNLRNDSIKVK